jgi:uncharacterized protein (UPF0276 family)
MTSISCVLNGAGVGLRLPHIAEAVATRPTIDWLEIHPENFLANPHATELLTELSQHYRISIHTVGLSVGSADGLDYGHLKRMKGLVDRIDPVFVSGHLAWSTHGGEYLNDLLPLPYDAESLRVVADNVREIQELFDRPYLVENPSSYVSFKNSRITETDFLSELVERTGCKLLCDVSNIWVSAHNLGFDPVAYLDSLSPDAIAEIHLGGYTPDEDEANPGKELLIDTHASPIADPAWDLYAHAIRRFGPRPTLIEWDNHLPAFQRLLDESRRADRIAAAVLDEVCHADAR